MTDLDPKRILDVLESCGVAYVLIGGYAAVLHGSTFTTFDIDITPKSGQDNLAHLSQALTELNARVRTEGVDDGLPFAHDAESLGRAGIWNLTTDAGDLDISLVPTGTAGYDDLIRDVIVIELYEHHVAVASLADIIRSKQAANRPKDQLTLPTLRKLLEEQERAD